MRAFDIITTNMKEQAFHLLDLNLSVAWEIRKGIEEITILEGSKRTEVGLGTIGGLCLQ